MSNELLRSDSTALLNMLIMAQMRSRSIDRYVANTEHRLLYKIATILPYQLYNVGFNYLGEDKTATPAINKFIQWSRELNFDTLCRDAIIDARQTGDSFIILDDGKPLDLPITRPPIALARFTQVSVLPAPLLLFGSNNVHESRVLHFCGLRRVSQAFSIEQERRDRYLNNSIFSQELLTAIELLDKSPSIMFRLLETLSQFGLGMDGLASMLYNDLMSGDTTTATAVQSRAKTINANRSIDGVAIFDKEQEQLVTISTNSTGATELYESIKDYISILTEIPKQDLFNSADKVGMSSGMQNQIVGRATLAENVKRWAKVYVIPQVQKVADLFGRFKIDVPVTINLDPIESAEYELKLAQRNKLLLEMGVITTDEIRANYIQNSDRTPMTFSIDPSDSLAKSGSELPETHLKSDEIKSDLDAAAWESLLEINDAVVADIEAIAAIEYNNG